MLKLRYGDSQILSCLFRHLLVRECPEPSLKAGRSGELTEQHFLHLEKALTGQRSVQVGKMSITSIELALPVLGDLTVTVTILMLELLTCMLHELMSEFRRV